MKPAAAVAALLELDSVAENDRAVEREPRLRTVPGDVLANRVFRGPLAARPLADVRLFRTAVLAVLDPGGPKLASATSFCAISMLAFGDASFTVADSLVTPQFLWR